VNKHPWVCAEHDASGYNETGKCPSCSAKPQQPWPPLVAPGWPTAADVQRERERNWQAVLLLRKALQMLRGGNCCDGEDATMSDENKAFQKELDAYLETFEEPENVDPDWGNGVPR